MTITPTQWDGNKVSVDCVVDGMPIDFYHGDSTVGPGISSSGLRKIESRSPAHYWVESYLNPSRVPRKPSDHFDFGKAAHTLLLGEDGFREQFAVRPEEFSDYRTKAAQQWRVEMQLSGKSILTPADVDAIRGIAKSMEAHPTIMAGILNGAVEQSIFWQDEKTGVWLRARPDVIPTSDGVVSDLKTTTDASPHAVQGAVGELGYAMQGALIGAGMKKVLGVEMTDFVLVFVEKTPPFAVNVAPVDPEWIYWAGRQNRRAIDTFAKCVETGVWPAYEGERTVSMPEWRRKRLEAEAQYGLLPEIAA